MNRMIMIAILFFGGCMSAGVKDQVKKPEVVKKADFGKVETVNFIATGLMQIWPQVTKELFVEKGMTADFEPGYKPLTDFFKKVKAANPGAGADQRQMVKFSVKLWNIHRSTTVDDVVVFMEPGNHCKPIDFRQALSLLRSPTASPLDEWKAYGPKRLPYLVVGGTKVACPGVVGVDCYCHPLIGRSKDSDTVFFKWVNANPSNRECDVNEGLVEKWDTKIGVGVVINPPAPVLQPTSQPASQSANTP